jgi:hypothetical protein
MLNAAAGFLPPKHRSSVRFAGPWRAQGDDPRITARGNVPSAHGCRGTQGSIQQGEHMVASIESMALQQPSGASHGGWLGLECAGRTPDPAWVAALEWANRQLDPAAITRHMQGKRSMRERAIDDLVAVGTHGDRMVCTILHDAEHAPLTTNLAQVLALGVDLAPHDPACPHGRMRRTALVIAALAWHDIYFSSTDHLDDDAFHELLFTAVLQDPVRDLPGGALVHEWVDLATAGADGLRERWLSWYASDGERSDAAADGEPVPPRRRRDPSRDAALPRPSRP